MGLKDYQQTNLKELDRFLTCVDKRKNTAAGFYEFWQTNNPPLTPFPGTIIEPYKDNVAGAPHVCLKVPTGGGKTLIASAAIKVAMNHINLPYKVVVWLVPSNAILEQTLRNLRDKQHPYRQCIDTDFQNRVEVFDKQQALTGHGFTLTNVRESLCILVISYDSFRTRTKDGRKVYQENGYLQSFAPLVASQSDSDDEVQLMKVLQAVHPLVIVDESHNAVSQLSEQMLNDLQPSLVIDLTATPKQNSNIICFTSALELKKENMVKLPVIVYNHSNKNQVIDSALHLQRRLEQTAKEQNGKYIRPIVLFQAESKQEGAEDRETFDKVKQTLLSLKIPEEQIKIKTAEIDELKGVDLMSKDCPVRYIITINALKEGWDCPFAYILASLADRSSSVDVEQIVGRVLRLPYVSRNKMDILNLSYVLTASAKFQDTLDNVVKGLNKAGFSDQDYRAVDPVEPLKPEPETREVDPGSLFPMTKPVEEERNSMDDEDEIDITEITFKSEGAGYEPIEESSEMLSDSPLVPESVEGILESAQKEAEEMEKKLEKQDDITVAPEIAPQVKTATIQTIFVESAKQVCLPMFFMKNNSLHTSLFGRPDDVRLENNHLLKTFNLSTQDANISFNTAEATMYSVDIDEATGGNAPRYEKVKGATYTFLLDYIRSAEDFQSKIRRCSNIVASEMGKMLPLTQKDIQGYVARIFDGFNDEQLEDFMLHLSEYTKVIKKKIIALEDDYKEIEFRKLIDQDKIFLKNVYSIPNKISLSMPSQGIIRMLHTKEESVNGFERDVINDVANLDNIEWWTRNVEKRGFFINGFINHYPDFIIKTKKGKIVLLETKGDHLDAAKKIRLGNLWASKAGNDYRYFLMYEERNVEGAYTRSQLLDIIKNL